MRSLLFVLVFGVVPSALADWREDCRLLSGGAQDVMRARQLGVPIASMMEGTSSDPFFEDVVIKAYETPRFNTKEAQEKQAVEFGNQVYLLCLKRQRQ